MSKNPKEGAIEKPLKHPVRKSCTSCFNEHICMVAAKFSEGYSHALKKVISPTETFEDVVRIIEQTVAEKCSRYKFSDKRNLTPANDRIEW